MYFYFVEDMFMAKKKENILKLKEWMDKNYWLIYGLIIV
jgi:hypothetical protein